MQGRDPVPTDSELTAASSGVDRPAGGQECGAGTGAIEPVEDAVGAAQVHLSIDVPPGTRVRVTIETFGPDGQPAGDQDLTIEGPQSNAPVHWSLPVSAPPRAGLIQLWLAKLKARSVYGLGTTLFTTSLLVYAVTRLVGLTDFPIYFFTDEAVQTVLAADLVRDNFSGYAGDFMPTFFENGGKYRLGVSVYMQVLPYLLFDKSVFVTRAVSALIAMLAAAAVALILRENFASSYWWSGVLFLSIAPAWFLHSRTAFEYAPAVAFYALGLWLYLRYRTQDPKYLYAALIAFGLAFYTYSPFQVIVPTTGGLLLLSDWRYHWSHRRVVMRGLGVLILLALPYARFMAIHPGANQTSLSALDSYLVKPLPAVEKLDRFVVEYLRGLSPGYWFNRNSEELPRHLMKGYGHLSPFTMPLIAWGLVISIRRIFSSTGRAAAYRAVLVVLLAIPAGAAIVQVGVTRLLAITIPAVLLTVIGLSDLLERLERRGVPRVALALPLFAGLALLNLTMLRDALENGPTWYQDYGMGGMQYGAIQVFNEVRSELERDPDTKIIFSPTWANGTDVIARFMLPDPLPIQIGSVAGHMEEKRPLSGHTLFVMTPEEYEQTLESEKFTDLQVERTLPYPNGKAGFYFVRMDYVDNIDSVFEAEQVARSVLREEEIILGGEQTVVRYPLLDIGEIFNIFDGDPASMARTREANPFVVELRFVRPRQLSGIDVLIGSVQARITLRLFQSDSAGPVEFSGIRRGSVAQPQVSLDFEDPVTAEGLRLEIMDMHQSEPAHVHIWELILR